MQNHQRKIVSSSLFQSTLAKSLDILEIQFSNHWDLFNKNALDLISQKASTLSQNDIANFYKNEETRFPYQELCTLAVITSATLLECIINWVLQVMDGESMTCMEKIHFRKKWLETPKKFWPNYEVSEDLKTKFNWLYQSRNAIVHHKPILEFNDGSTATGTMLDVFGTVPEGRIAQVAFNLPTEMCTNLLIHSDKENHFILWNGMTDILPKDKMTGAIIIPQPKSQQQN